MPPRDHPLPSKPSQFRFKSQKRRRDPHDDPQHSGEHHHHSSHHQSKRHKPTHTHSHAHTHTSTAPHDPSLYDDINISNAYWAQYLDPDSSFRESLFDALADDEGAAFWEGVYGQPIHTYSSTRPGPEGEFERMTDEQYASFVRARMWEKSHGFVEEERRRREEANAREREWEAESRRLERERREFQRVVEERLKRGEERKVRARWREAWKGYLEGWERFKIAGAGAGRGGKGSDNGLKNRVLWPVESGGWRDVSKERIESFFRNAPMADNPGGDLLGVLKTERVRWHPDKIQQRFGKHGIEVGVMKAVTAVFQIVDTMWSELREKKK